MTVSGWGVDLTYQNELSGPERSFKNSIQTATLDTLEAEIHLKQCWFSKVTDFNALSSNMMIFKHIFSYLTNLCIFPSFSANATGMIYAKKCMQVDWFFNFSAKQLPARTRTFGGSSVVSTSG